MTVGAVIFSIPLVLIVAGVAACAIASAVTLPLFVIQLCLAIFKSVFGPSPAQADRSSDQPAELVQQPLDHRLGVRGEDGQP